MPPLGLMLTAYIQKHDVQPKALAKRLGICESTLTRIRQGKMPDAEGLARIMLWMTQPD